MAHSTANRNDRLSIAASNDAANNAPELDKAPLAPQYRGDNTPPEVSAGQGIQVLYDSSALEPAVVDSSEETGISPSSDTSSPHQSRKKLIIWILAVQVLVAAGLGIGLGVGLKRGEGDNTSTSASASPSPSLSTQTSATNGSSKHDILDNTPLAAITLPNGNRHVYFQERTGAFRRAMYSSQAKLWRVGVDQELATNAKNNTPLAAVTGLTMFMSGPDYVFEEPNDFFINTATLFYVNSTNQLSCVAWVQSRSNSCLIMDMLPTTLVATDFHQKSATILRTNQNQRSLLLTYQSFFQRPVVLLGFVENIDNHSKWTWRNETAKLYPDSATEPFDSIDISACSVGCSHTFSSMTVYYALYCFLESKKNRTEIASFRLNYPSPGNLTIAAGPLSFYENSSLVIDSDIASLSQGTILFLDQSQLKWGFGLPSGDIIPLPEDKLPFDRLASTVATNSTSSYLYYQLDDTTIAENLWDGTSGFWIPNNITIDTS